MRILITGANGFLGAEIVQQAVHAGLQVRAIYRSNPGETPEAEWCQADITQPTTLSGLFEGVNVVIHAAGLAHVFEAGQHSELEFTAVNEQGTSNVVEAAAAAGVSQIVLVSSVSVYGKGTGDKSEADSVCRPETPYARSKWQAESRAIQAAKQLGINLSILRLATIYGEGDPGNVARLMHSIDRSRFIWIGNGSNLKSLIHKEDAARACLRVAQAKPTGIHIYNVSAPPSTLQEVVEGLTKALDRQPLPFKIPSTFALTLTTILTRIVPTNNQVASLRKTLEKWLANDVYNGSQFETKFGFTPRVTLEDGLRRQVDWYKKHGA